MLVMHRCITNVIGSFLESEKKCKFLRGRPKKNSKYCQRLRCRQKNNVLGCVSAKMNYFVGVYKSNSRTIPWFPGHKIFCRNPVLCKPPALIHYNIYPQNTQIQPPKIQHCTVNSHWHIVHGGIGNSADNSGNSSNSNTKLGYNSIFMV